MTVSQIIAKKGKDVLTALESDTLGQVAKVLADRKIGAVVILNGDQSVAGILSERDIVCVVGAKGAAALDEPVGQVMTRKVITCSESDTINSVMEKMTAGRFRHLPIVEDGKLAGIVSIGDVVKHRMQEIETEAEQLRSYIQAV